MCDALAILIAFFNGCNKFGNFCSIILFLYIFLYLHIVKLLECCAVLTNVIEAASLNVDVIPFSVQSGIKSHTTVCTIPLGRFEKELIILGVFTNG
jgi:hypothetical protein